MKIVRRIVAYALLAAVLAAVVYVVMNQGEQAKKRAGRRGASEGPVPVLVEPARLADVPVYFGGVGTIKALNTVTVRSQVDGKLMSVKFREGQDVKRGDVLAQIDPTTFQAALDQAIAKKAQDEAQLANAKLDLERYERLAKTNSATKQQADTQRALVAQLDAQVKSDQAAIENAQAVLSYTTIVAPISGRTGIRLVDEGNIIHASDANGLVVITEIQPIAVLFTLPQQQLSRVNQAFAKGPLTVEALGPDDKSVVDRGKLQVVDNQVDPTTGTVKLKAEFPNPDLQLWPGQFINVRLLVDTLHRVVVVPTSAVQRGPNGTFVFVVQENETVKVRPVKIGLQDDLQAVVTDGLRAAERVVTTGFARLADGSQVKISSPEGSPSAEPSAERRKGRRKGASGLGASE